MSVELVRVAILDITDDELRRLLIEYGEKPTDIGPIISTTKKVWLKRLEKLKKEAKVTAAQSRKLIGFSSDESDSAEPASTTSSRSRARPRSKNSVASKKSAKDSSSKTTAVARDETDTFVVPSIPSVAKRQSDKFTVVGLVDSTTRGRGGVERSSRVRGKAKASTAASVPVAPEPDLFDSTDPDDSDHQDNDLTYVKKPTRSYVSAAVNTSPGLDISGSSNHFNSPGGKYGYTSPSASYLSSDYSPTSPDNARTGNNSHAVPSTSSTYGIRARKSYRTNNDSSKGLPTFPGKKDEGDGDGTKQDLQSLGFQVSDVSDTSYIHYTSKLLILVVVAFFLCLGIVYIVGVSKSYLYREITDQSESAVQADVKWLTKELCDHLSYLKGQVECNYYGSDHARLAEDKARSYLLDRHPNLDAKHWKKIMETIKGLPYISLSISEKKESEKEIEWNSTALLPYKPLLCRIQQATSKVMYGVLVILGILAMVGLGYSVVLFRKRQKEERWRQVYELVENIIDVLKQHQEQCQENKDTQTYLPIPHVRDMLIQPKDRKKRLPLWDQAVEFLEASESRIRVETHNVHGEEFMCWRWLGGASNTGKKVWQGQAFGEHAKNSPNAPVYSPTPCLKVRNMFDSDIEWGEDWEVGIQDAILEKACTDCKIVHIAVDKNSREGCVYIKCANQEAAGKTFRSLHGWWFDGNLVTVKFLRLERYHERFPDSRECESPMIPSNNKQLSLSQPFHQSPLESC